MTVFTAILEILAGLASYFGAKKVEDVLMNLRNQWIAFIQESDLKEKQKEEIDTHDKINKQIEENKSKEDEFLK